MRVISATKTKVIRNDIFQNEYTTLRAAVKKITSIMRKLDEQTKTKETDEHTKHNKKKEKNV